MDCLSIYSEGRNFDLDVSDKHFVINSLNLKTLKIIYKGSGSDNIAKILQLMSNDYIETSIFAIDQIHEQI